MAARPLHQLSIAEIGAALRGGGLSAVDLARHALDRIDRYDRHVNAVVWRDDALTLARAAQADADLAAGHDHGPLHGVPYGLKDIFDVEGLPTRCNSRLRVGHIAPEDSAIEQRLKQAGAVLTAKLNTHEFALGGPSADLPFPIARNPWDLDRFTGGSSSGSGAAVAAGYVRFAIGSDTGGSIRSPASHCGVVGIKPTRDLLSMRGAFPLSWTLDHAGLLARSSQDAAIVLGVLAGDRGLAGRAAPPQAPGLTGLTVGYARDFFRHLGDTSAETVAVLDAAASALARLGASVFEVQLPDYELFKASGRLIMIAEAYAIHEADLKAHPEMFGRCMFQRVAPAAALSCADIIQAYRVRYALEHAFNDGPMATCDAIITAAGLAPAADLRVFDGDWPPPGPAMGMLTAPFNVTGNPVVCAPIGLYSDGPPIGMQIIAKPRAEDVALRVAGAIGETLGTEALWPPLDSQIQVASVSPSGSPPAAVGLAATP